MNREIPPCHYQNAPIGLCFLDVDLRFVHINDWLAKINGLPVEAHIGRKIREILPAVADAAEAQFQTVLKTGEPLSGRLFAETAAHPGERRNYKHTYYPAKPDGDRVTGIHCVVEDVTDRVNGAAADDKARLKLLTDREAAVFGLLADGWARRSIAEKLHLSPRTVDSHRLRTMECPDFHVVFGVQDLFK